jgi:putative transposase
MTRKTIKRRGRDGWRQIIAGQQTSGQSVAEYCLERKLSPKSFYGWRRKLKIRSENQPEAFVELGSFGEKATRVLRVTTPGGYHLEVPEQTGVEDIRNLLKALASL